MSQRLYPAAYKLKMLGKLRVVTQLESYTELEILLNMATEYQIRSLLIS